MPSRLRRARSLVAWWEGGEFLVENFLSGRRSAVSPLVGHLLAGFEEFLTPTEAGERFAELPGREEILQALVAQDILLVEGSELELRDRRLDDLWAWPLDARLFHYSSRRVVFQDRDTQERELRRLAREQPAPPPYKRCGGDLIELPCDFAEPRGELWETLLRRRSRRELSRRPLTLAQLSRLLLWTWGRTRAADDPDLGPFQLKTSPSGGARHPIEVYPVVQRVAGLAAGVYHYAVDAHALERLAGPVSDDRLAELCGGQPWIRDAAAVFMMAAVLERSMWKYRQSHAYRVIHLDAGHLGQTFHLVATGLGLAPLSFGALAADDVETLLGLDGIGEIVLYAAAVGHPAAGARLLDSPPAQPG